MKRSDLSCEDLASLYVDQMLSAPEIAKQCGCSVGTIYTRLEECEIAIRSKSEAALLDRGVEVSCDELKTLYVQEEFSIYEIAERYACSPTTIHRGLKKCGIQARPAGGDEFEYPKKDFDGSGYDYAYLLGFRQGDLHVERGSRAIRIRCTSTRPEQIELVRELFVEYGGIWISKPRLIRGTGITAHLNLSFEFLVAKNDKIEPWICANDKLFAAFWAGYVDAEGSFIVSGRRACFKVDACDKEILHQGWAKLEQMGIKFPPPRIVRRKGTLVGRLWSKCDLWRVASEKKDTLLQLCELIGPHLKHQERIRDMQRMKAVLESRKGGENDRADIERNRA